MSEKTNVSGIEGQSGAVYLTQLGLYLVLSLGTTGLPCRTWTMQLPCGHCKTWRLSYWTDIYWVILDRYAYHIMDTSHVSFYAADAHICAFSLVTQLANSLTIVTCLSGVCMTDLFPLLTLCLCFFPVARSDKILIHPCKSSLLFASNK